MAIVSGTLSPPEFFQAQTTKSALTQTRGHVLSALHGPSADEKMVHMLQMLHTMIDLFLRDPVLFDRNTEFNINHVAGNLLTNMVAVSSATPPTETVLAAAFATGYRFIVELDFAIPQHDILEVHALKNYVAENLQEFPDPYRGQLIYAGFQMPVSIAREMVHHPGMADAKKFMEVVGQADTKKRAWDAEISAKEKKIAELQDALAKVAKGFNFVGLVDGFKDMYEEKRKGRHWAFFLMFVLAVAALAPLIIEFYTLLGSVTRSDFKIEGLLYFVPVLLGIEILLIYFFRISLANFRSLSAQMLQLKLRTTLCQFIESYSDYSTVIKEKDKSALERFETMIFSGLVSSDENLPSTFDGIEQVAKLLEAVRGKQ